MGAIGSSPGRFWRFLEALRSSRGLLEVFGSSGGSWTLSGILGASRELVWALLGAAGIIGSSLGHSWEVPGALERGGGGEPFPF